MPAARPVRCDPDVIDLLSAPRCAPDTWCSQVWTLTGNDWLANATSWFAVPLKILLIVVVAIAVRWFARRLIDRLTAFPVNGDALPALLRPLRERSPERFGSVMLERRRQRAQTIGSVLKSVVSFLVFGLALTYVLYALEVNLAPIITSAGVVGVAVGFGAQSLVRDFLSGMFMMLEDQYGVGDVVDVGEATGTVESVGLRIVTLRDLNGTVWYVRNGEVLRVGNSSQGYAVAVVDVPVSYDANVDRATSVLRKVAAEAAESEGIAKDVLETPEVLGVENVTAEGIQLRLTVKVRAGQQWAVQRALRAQIMAALEQEGFQPPISRMLSGGAGQNAKAKS